MRPLGHKQRWTQITCRYGCLLLAVVLLTFPLYITAYRVSVADLVPIDDYRQLVISLKAGNLEGFSSPFGYRILSPLLAVALSKIDPPLFSRTSDNVSQEWIQATFALCTVSYLFLVLTTLVLYAYLRSIYIPLNGILLTLVIFWLSPARENYLYPLTDASAIFFIAILYWMYEKDAPKLFFLGSLFAVMAKEIAIIVPGLTLIFHLFRQSERRKRASIYLFLLCPSIILYLLARMILQFPGNESQLHWWEYPTRFLSCPQLLFTVRGILLNIYPLWPISVAVLAFIALKHQKQPMPSAIFHVSHIGVTIVLIFLGMALDVKYNIGRIVFLSFPLFTPAIGWYGAELLKTAEEATFSEEDTHFQR